MTLIEVLMASVLVALVAVATFSAFDVTNRATADERAHAQATLIAQQDEERMRGESFAALVQTSEASTQNVSESGLCVEQVSSAWKYCPGTALAGTAYSGTVFTVESTHKYVSSEKEAATCEVEKGGADYVGTTSTVTWNGPGPVEHRRVSQSSFVSVPQGRTLMVKVKNRNNEPVSGATVEVTGEKASYPSQITPASGCVIYGDLSDKEVKVEANKAGWVDRNGKSPPASEEVQLAANALTEAPAFKIEAPGTIAAEFVSNGAASESYTFDALHPTEMSFPEFLVGGEAGAVKHTQELANAFPFVEAGSPPKESRYTVFAGDCEANNPAKVSASLKDESVQVEPGAVAHVTVEAPTVTATVYEGASATTPEKLLPSSYSAKVINKECEGKAAQNFPGGVSYEHPATITAGALVQDHLPYAKTLELCVVGKLGTTYYKNKWSFANTAKAGTTLPAYYLKGSGYTKSTSALTC